MSYSVISTTEVINTFLLEGTSHGIRIIVTGAATIVGNILCCCIFKLPGLLIIVTSIFIGGSSLFLLCLLGITFAGTASRCKNSRLKNILIRYSFGESVCLGFSFTLTTFSPIRYLKHGFPPELVNYWASGTGMAGVFGSGLYLFLKAPFIDLADQFSLSVYLDNFFKMDFPSYATSRFRVLDHVLPCYKTTSSTWANFVGQNPFAFRASRFGTKNNINLYSLLIQAAINSTNEVVTTQKDLEDGKVVQKETKGQRVKRCIKISLWYGTQVCTWQTVNVLMHSSYYLYTYLNMWLVLVLLTVQKIRIIELTPTGLFRTHTLF